MKAVHYIKQTIKSIHLVYATCMNDVIIYSKQASNISYLSLPFYRVQPTFIADTVYEYSSKRSTR
jgi:hypothetical protein